MATQSSDNAPVLYETNGAIATITLNRPEYANAQNSKMTYAIDNAFQRAVDDDEIAVIVLTGAGKHFSAGHDIGTPERDHEVDYPRVAALLPTHVGKRGGEQRLTREMEVYIGMCRRWREIPKPTIAMVHGACVAGGLMLAWSCDLIVASDDSYFSDPVVGMGISGVEYFAHPWVMSPRAAKEFLFTGRRMSGIEAAAQGMINYAVPTEDLASTTYKLAERISQMPRFGLELTKRAVNQSEDAMGMRVAMDSVFGLHHLAHAHNSETGGDSLAGQDVASMKRSAEES